MITPFRFNRGAFSLGFTCICISLENLLFNTEGYRLGGGNIFNIIQPKDHGRYKFSTRLPII